MDELPEIVVAKKLKKASEDMTKAGLGMMGLGCSILMIIPALGVIGMVIWTLAAIVGALFGLGR
jgi:hypothetical protein